jgi:hypothetical protein
MPQRHRAHSLPPRWGRPLLPLVLAVGQTLSERQGTNIILMLCHCYLPHTRRPVDVSTREKEVAERLDKEREAAKDRLSMSRTNSRQASERTPISNRTPPPTSATGSQTTGSPKVTNSQLKAPSVISSPSVRPTLSFANVAANKETASENKGEKTKDEKNGN